MNETDEPYRENATEPVENLTTEPPRFPHAKPPQYAKISQGTKNRCPICHQEFNSKQELTVHMETVHSSPKKKP